MTLPKHLLLLFILFFNACHSQNPESNTTINYMAQTRGFIYSINLKNKALEINNNNEIQQIILTKNQLIELEEVLQNINFEKIESRISTEDLAVDKAIKGVFKLTYKKKQFTFNFNHNSLPKEIDILIQELERFAN